MLQTCLTTVEEHSESVVKCKIVWDDCAFVHYNNYDQACLAHTQLNGYLYEGKHLNIELFPAIGPRIEQNKLTKEASIVCFRAPDLRDAKWNINDFKIEKTG